MQAIRYKELRYKWEGFNMLHFECDYTQGFEPKVMEALVKTNLENSIYSVKNVDQTEATVKALMAANNLNASYAVMQTVMNISLLNYLK